MKTNLQNKFAGGKMKIIRIVTVLVILILFNSYETKAQTFNDVLRLTDPDILSSPKALSMGNAFTSLSNDFSATLFNPAGLGLVKKFEFSGGFNYNSFKNQATFFNNNTSFSNNSTKFKQFGFVFPLPTYQGSFVLALGYNQYKDFNRALKFNGYNNGNHSLIQDLTGYNDDIAYELGLSYPIYDNANKYIKDVTVINGKLNQSGSIIQEGGLNSWSLGGAVELQKDIFVGISFNIINGDFKRNRKYTEADINNNYPMTMLLDPKDPATADFQTFYFNDIIKWDISGWDAVLGIIAKLDYNINLGLSIKTPRKINIKETYLVDADAYFGTGTHYVLDPPIENKLEYDVETPYEFTLGASYAKDNFTFSFDAKFIDYTQMEFKGGLEQRAIEKKNSDIKDLFQNVLNLYGGIEYIIPRTGIALRGGLMFMPSPFKGDPSDFDKKFITAGIGFTTSRKISFNFSYAYGWWKDVGDNYGSGISRTYQDISRSNYMMGIKYSL